MQVFVKGKGIKVELSQRDYVGGGGQGNVYARGNTAYKVYHDRSDMLPEGKIRELAEIRDPCVIKPLDVLVDGRGHSIGYTTTFVKNAWTLCQLFPLSFRHREGLKPEQTEELVRKLQERISNVHASSILIVDVNEMNFLVAKNFGEVYGIDVDSYETPHYPATAIMDSIRDWTAKKWSPLSDWYSFGVLAFQMFVGVHPFKGKYHGPKIEFRSKLPTDSADDTFAVTRRRMQSNISVYHPQVSVPGAVLPFDTIPVEYRKWFEALFVHGKRGLPPSAFAPVIFVPTVVKQVAGTAQLDIMEIGSYEGTVIGVWTTGATFVVGTDKGVWVDGGRVPMNPALHCGFSGRTGRSVLVYMKNHSPLLYNATDRTEIGPVPCDVEEVSSYDGRIYVRTSESVYEVVLNDMGSVVYPTLQEVVQTLPHASRLYPGVVVQRLLGTTYVSLLVASGSAQQVAIKELEAYRVVDAKYDSGVLMVVGEQKGRFDRLVFRFDTDGKYDVRVVSGVPLYGLNFVTLDTGICVCLNEDEKLEVFSSTVGRSKIKFVEDSEVVGDIRLWKQAGAVLFSKGNRVYRMKMR